MIVILFSDTNEIHERDVDDITCEVCEFVMKEMEKILENKYTEVLLS